MHLVACTVIFLSPSSRPCSPGQVLLSIGWCGPLVLTLAVMLCWAPCSSDRGAAPTAFSGRCAFGRRAAACAARAPGRAARGAARPRPASGDPPLHLHASYPAGALHLEQRDYQAAEARFLALVQAPDTKHDAYAWLGLATLNFVTAPAERRKARAALRPPPAQGPWDESAAPACPARPLIRYPLGSCRAPEAMPPLVRYSCQVRTRLRASRSSSRCSGGPSSSSSGIITPATGA